MSEVMGLCFHALIACSVWQLAEAAPTIALHSLAASGGETLGVVGHQPCLNVPSHFKFDRKRVYIGPFKSFHDVPLDETVPCTKDTHYDEGKMFDWAISNLLKQPSDAPIQNLGLETVYQWKPLVKQYQQLMGGKIGALKAWLKKNHVAQGSNSEQDVSDLEWLLHRAGSPKGIWWGSNQLAHWRESKYDWKSMIKVGDQLQFDHAEHDFTLSKNKISDVQEGLIPVLESGKWTPPLLAFASGSKGGAEASREFQVLRAIGGKESLYDKRIGQVIDKIVRKMDEYRGDQVQLPAHLNSDLYLLALLRGKVIKPRFDSQLQYVVTMPRHMVTVRKPFAGQALRASFRAESRGRGLAETHGPAENPSAQNVRSTSFNPKSRYQWGQAIDESGEARSGKVWSTPRSPSQVETPVPFKPTGGRELNKTLLVSLTESPSKGGDVEKRGGGGEGGGRGGGGEGGGSGEGSGEGSEEGVINPKYAGGHGQTSAASRAESPWETPVRVFQHLADIFTNGRIQIS